jgi:predicted GNAT superfamily acetyltransferase
VIAITEPTRAELPAAARLLGTTLGFDPADAVPAWLMLTAADCGGLVLVARHDGEVVGASFAIAALRDGAPTCSRADWPSRHRCAAGWRRRSSSNSGGGR